MGWIGDKVALVTGGASGIGAACSVTLARAGAKVVIADIDDERGTSVRNAVRAAGGEAIYLDHNVVDESSWMKVVEIIEGQFGRLDILVSNAGIALNCPSIVDMTLTDWRKQTAINLDGVFLSVKYCIPAIRRGARGGSIILMSSVAGLRGAPSLSGYSATKGGVRLFAKSIAMECAAAGDGIRVNSVHPGIIDTPLWGKMSNPAGSGHNVALRADQLGRGSPIGAAGHPQDIADGVLFLASDESRYMTGAELVIDGGYTAGSSRSSRS